MVSAAYNLADYSNDIAAGNVGAANADLANITSNVSALSLGLVNDTPPAALNADEGAVFQYSGMEFALSDYGKFLSGAIQGIVAGALDQHNPVEVDEFGVHDGTFHAPLDYATYGGFGADQAKIITLQDPDGNSMVLLPADIPHTPYSDMQVQSVDPFTGRVLNSQTVDLSDLNTEEPSSPTPIPAVPTRTPAATPTSPPAPATSETWYLHWNCQGDQDCISGQGSNTGVLQSFGNEADCEQGLIPFQNLDEAPSSWCSASSNPADTGP
jgi:hypothetical protein